MLCKRDVRYATELIPLAIRMISPADVSVGGYLSAYLSTYLGWGGAPGNWGATRTILVQIPDAQLPRRKHRRGHRNSASFQFVEDGVCRTTIRAHPLNGCEVMGIAPNQFSRSQVDK